METSRRRYVPFTVALGLFLSIFFVSSSSKAFVLLLPIYEAMGISLGAIGVVVVIASAIMFGTSLIAKRFYDRFGIKQVMIAGALLSGCYYVILAYFQSFWGMVTALLLMGFASTLCGYLPASMIINKWFRKSRATVLGIVFTGMSIGGAIYSLAFGYLFEQVGLMGTCLALGAAVALGGSLSVFVFVKDAPENYGLEPYGGFRSVVVEDHLPSGHLISLPAAKARRSSIYFSIIMISLVGCGVLSTIQAYLPAFWQSAGHSTFLSAQFYSLMIVVGAPATIIGGYIADRTSATVFVLYTAVLMVIATAMLVVFAEQTPYMVSAAIIMGIAYPLSSITPALLLGDIYAKDTYDELIGLLQGVTMSSMALLFPIVGFMYDAFGNFDLAFSMMGMMSVIIFIFLGIYSRAKSKVAIFTNET